MRKTKIIRVDEDFGEYLNRKAVELANQLGKPVSIPEVTKILAEEERKKKRGGEMKISVFHI